MKKSLFVSIIIPLYVISDRFFNDFKKYENLDYDNFEIIVVCDKKIEIPKLENIPIKLLLTKRKNTGPAEKRDLVLKHTEGDICAFIDDDAYPREDWLKNAVQCFENNRIVAVGGPGVTPPEDSFWQKIGGYIIESYLCSGGIQNRFYTNGTKKKRYVSDWPAFNLIVKTDILKKVGGYGSSFYGGEDTLLCLKLLKYGKILFSSDVLVFHHRRMFPKELLKQIAGVGTHRGYFFKKYPETSRKLFYLLPTFLTLGLATWLLLSLLIPEIFLGPFLLAFVIFGFLGSYSIKRHKVDTLSSIISGLGIIVTHMTYGVYFIKGLLTSDLKR